MYLCHRCVFRSVLYYKIWSTLSNLMFKEWERKRESCGRERYCVPVWVSEAGLYWIASASRVPQQSMLGEAFAGSHLSSLTVISQSTIHAHTLGFVGKFYFKTSGTEHKILTLTPLGRTHTERTFQAWKVIDFFMIYCVLLGGRQG